MQHAVYIALIGDLVASRELDAQQRGPIQVRLNDTLHRIHAQAGAGSVARPLITLGDEFQALLAPDAAGVAAVVSALDGIPEACRPLKVRFGLGVGALSTPLQPDAIGMDGPCFHRARAALEWAQDRKLSCWLAAPPTHPRRDTGHGTSPANASGAPSQLWSLLGCWLMSQRGSWTPPQREAVRLYRQLGNWKAVAERLGVTQGAISQRQRAADWRLAQATEATLAGALLQLVRSVAAEEDEA